MELQPRRVNVVIGEPDTGKSNLVEVFKLIYYLNEGRDLRELVRFNDVSELFYNLDLSLGIKIRVNHGTIIQGGFKDPHLHFQGFIAEDGSKRILFQQILGSAGRATRIQNDSEFEESVLTGIKPYKFSHDQTISRLKPIGYLLPVEGSNLYSVVFNNKKLKDFIKDLVKEFGYELIFDKRTRSFAVERRIQDVRVLFPYSVLPNTLQAMIFHTVAVYSNRDSFIVLDEPGKLLFPTYIKRLSEQIARDKANQYLITTHNPNFLIPLIEKTPNRDLNVLVAVRTRDNATSFKEFDVEKMINELDTDPFFNLNRYTK